MFTGIVEELGQVVEVRDLGDSVRLAVAGSVATPELVPGESIAVNGVCLTVITNSAGVFTSDVMRETLDRSSLADLAPGDAVNLERAMRLDGRLGGHLVQGHVDATATILDRAASPHWELVRITLPPTLSRYVVHKGSITVDGVSLTVADLADDSFAVSLIPTTLALTTLGRKHVGERVNLEVDVIAKYVEKLVALDRKDRP